MTYVRIALLLCILLVSINAKSVPTIATRSINTFPSIDWIQSEEYNLLCIQIYNTAKQNFLTLDLNHTTSVMLEQNQTKNFAPAVIVDIDETILLNLAFRKETMQQVGKYSYEIWEKHIHLKTAIPISGSLEYLNYLSRNGVKTIYISNRGIEDEDATFVLLKELGYPIETREDLLLKNEKKDWTKNKTSRRRYIGRQYKVIQLFGDSLRDFTETNATHHKNKFGKSWFLLPNPMYGYSTSKY